MATKKFSPAQLAAQKLFAERARAGTLGKGKRKANPAAKYRKNFDHWTVTYSNGAVVYFKTEESAKAEAGTNSLVVGIRAPLYGDNPGLYDNINAKRARIAAGSGERMRKPGSKGAPTQEAFEQSAMTAKRNPIMGPVQTKRVIQALEETQAALSRATRYSLENQDKDLIDFYKKHIAKLTKAIETGFFISDDRFSNRRDNPDKSKPRAYVKRASQITGAPPSKRLQTRRKMALKAPAGYFPNPEPSHDFARIGKPFAFDGRTWKVSQYSHNGKTIEAYTTDRKKFVRREFDVSELMSSRRKTNPTAPMMTGYQVICMHPKKHVVGIFKTMAEAKLVARAMADAKGVAYGVKAVKVHKAHFAV